MTEEKLAEEYVNSKADKGNFDLEQFGKAYFSESSMKQAFLAGLKAKTQWHDLRKNPDDLPEENTTVLLLTEVEPVTARYDKKYESFFRMNDKLDYCIFIAPMSYIAWCEIPTFEEER